MAKLRKNSTIKESEVLGESKFFKNLDEVQTLVPAINIALSGSLDGGLKRGSTIIAGPSRHFKSLFSLIMAEAYLKKHKDAVCLFYDSEFGTPIAYFESVGIDPSRVIHCPIADIEQLKFDIMNQLDKINRGDKVVIVIDSLGNLASKKEVDDALEGKSVADMTRAKQMKSLFRMITPLLTIKDIPLIGVNHIYHCGTEDMMVTTETGPVSLKDITTGMKVLTSNGFEVVSNTFEYDESFVTDIELEDGTLLSFTQGHRFKVNEEWVAVEDLKEGMYLDLI